MTERPVEIDKKPMTLHNFVDLYVMQILIR